MEGQMTIDEFLEILSMEDFSRITADDIDAILRSGSGVVQGKMRIMAFFEENSKMKARGDFLKSEYGIGGRSHAINGQQHTYEDHDARGILISKGDILKPSSTLLLKWDQVAKRIGELTTAGTYLTQKEQVEYTAYKNELLSKAAA